jgi:hypothetical protein
MLRLVIGRRTLTGAGRATPAVAVEALRRTYEMPRRTGRAWMKELRSATSDRRELLLGRTGGMGGAGAGALVEIDLHDASGPTAGLDLVGRVRPNLYQIGFWAWCLASIIICSLIALLASSGETMLVALLFLVGVLTWGACDARRVASATELLLDDLSCAIEGKIVMAHRGPSPRDLRSGP